MCVCARGRRGEGREESREEGVGEGMGDWRTEIIMINVLGGVRRVGQFVVVTQQLHLEHLADQVLPCNADNNKALRRSVQLCSEMRLA